MKNKTFRNDKLEISIVIPAYNEESAIRETLERVSKNHASYEIILVCDGCSDNTAEIAEEAEEFAKTNHRLTSLTEGPTWGRDFQ